MKINEVDRELVVLVVYRRAQLSVSVARAGKHGDALQMRLTEFTRPSSRSLTRVYSRNIDI